MEQGNDLYLEIRADGREGVRARGAFIPFLLPGERPDAICCTPWEWEKVSGAVMRACHRCGMAVSLAPSSVALLEEFPDVPVRCVHCVAKEVEEEKKR